VFVDNICEHLLVGGALVLVVLLTFLCNLRAALVSAHAIPMSLLTAALVLLGSGLDLDIMVLGGLAIALGEVVDDASIDTEKICRRLRENRAAAVPPTCTKSSCPPRWKSAARWFTPVSSWRSCSCRC
jgi:Cu/Ag efflux pump CusA